MAGGRRDRGLYGLVNVQCARTWLEVVETEDCMAEAECVRSRDVAGGMRDRGLYGGGSV